ncbi:MAG: CHASE domain-containing protein [Kordiimonadaceae bacterium]|nr:CHASE domain-containing protein [Kordiimonadaceae bacterium]
MFEKKHGQFSLIAPSAVVLAIGVLISAAVAGLYFQNTVDKGRAEFAREAYSQLDKLESVIQNHLDALMVSASLFQSVEGVGAENFSIFAKPLIEGRPGVRSIGWVPYVTEASLAEVEGGMQHAGLKILEQDLTGALRNVSRRSEYFPITYAEPQGRNRDALGLDFGADAFLRVALESAWASGQAVATSPIRVGTNNNQRAEIYVFAPVYERGADIATLRGRTQGIVGFALAVLDATSLAEIVVGTRETATTNIFIYDVAEDGVVVPVYSTFKGIGAGATFEYLGLTGEYPDKRIFVKGRSWHMLVKPVSMPAAPVQSALLIFLVGVALSLGTARYIHSLRVSGATKEQAVERGTQDLQEARNRVRGAELDIEIANKAKATFLATMSHELRTPLTGVLGYIELLCSKVTDPEHKQLIDKLRQAANAQRAIVNDVLDYSRISAGALTIESEPFRLQDVVDAAISTYGTIGKDKGVFVGSRTIPGVPFDFIGDPSRLQQVVNNLVSNAVKFTKEGSVTLHVGGTHVDRENFKLELIIQDTGIGITKEQKNRLFEPFVHTEDIMTRPFGGTGLGLSICREITEAMGGTISVESELDWGSKFVVSLMLPITELGDQAYDDEQSQKVLFAGVPLRILVVEDYGLVRDMLSTTLSKAGHVVVAVDNGSEAYEAVYSPVGEVFDLILMDMHMPIMDGAEAAQRIRHLEQSTGVPQVPIIGISADVMSEHIQRFKSAGINAFVPKPLDWKELGRVIQKVMRTSHEKVPVYHSHLPTSGEGAHPLLMENVFAEFVETLSKQQSSELFAATISFFKDCTAKLEDLGDKPDFIRSKELAHSIMGGASTIGAMRVSADAHNLCALSAEPEDLKDRITKLHDLMEQSEVAFDDEFQHVSSVHDNKSIH